MNEHAYATRRARELLALGWTRENTIRRIVMELRHYRSAHSDRLRNPWRERR